MRAFIETLAGHRDQSVVKTALDSGFDEASKTAWSNSAEVRKLSATASIVNAERIAFNIKGNDYMLVVTVDFERSIVWIKWIGTRCAYDEIDVSEDQHGN